MIYYLSSVGRLMRVRHVAQAGGDIGPVPVHPIEVPDVRCNGNSGGQ